MMKYNSTSSKLDDIFLTIHMVFGTRNIFILQICHFELYYTGEMRFSVI
jgi:hypothetical protein